jgi:hypothetical protein
MYLVAISSAGDIILLFYSTATTTSSQLINNQIRNYSVLYNTVIPEGVIGNPAFKIMDPRMVLSGMTDAFVNNSGCAEELPNIL